jgi:methylmalonyl-CoA mutase N-terminal domain/subunit
MEKGIWDYIEKIDAMGGYIAALESGYLQREIAVVNAKYSYDLDSGKKVLVGVNKYQPEEGEKEYPVEVSNQDPIRTHRIMTERLRKLRAERDGGRVKEILAEFKEAVSENGYLMPILIEASKAYCTTSEVFSILKEVLGEDKRVLVPDEWKG